ncbi:hypothetical protein ACQKWADRAFT_294793 [Trichoderma austrokoningii]
METCLPEPRTRSPPRNDELGDIAFRHPGYSSLVNILSTLARSDCEDRNGTIIFGLHHRTTLLMHSTLDILPWIRQVSKGLIYPWTRS